MTNLLPGIELTHVETPRLRTAIRTDDRQDGEVVLFVHGNVSSSLFWQECILALPEGYRGIAADLRGFGESETAPIDATRGVRDFSDDVLALLDALGIERAHLVGWSMGGGIVMQMLLDRPEIASTLTLVSPVSPYGFGATKGADGQLTSPDGAGSGGASAGPDFVAAIAAGDRGAESQNSPRNVLNGLYFANGFRSEHEDMYVESMLSTVVGQDNYPGDSTPSENWPGFAPGTRGVLNTMTPGYYDVSGVIDLPSKPAILWIHGADDAIVSDASMFDLATLGSMGAIPGWPGAEECPSQPMVTQMRHVLDAYTAAGGACTEVILECGHAPMVEKPDEYQAAFTEFLLG